MSVISTGSSNGLFLKSQSNVFGFGATINADGSFVSSTGASIRNVTANPNGSVTAAAGSIALRSNGVVYLNLNGATLWQVIGGITVPNNSSIVDVPNGGALPTDTSGNLALVVAAGIAETRTLANPTVPGVVLNISCASVGAGGTCAITVAGAINQANNTIITVNAVADYIQLTSITRGANVRWQVVANDGCVLS